ncbi:MAG: ZIP family metal transporter [Flavobacteriales bacterium]
MTSGLILFLVAMVGAALGEAMGHSLRRQLPLLLAFGGAFLLGLCFLHLLPEAFEANSRAGLWVIGGFLVQIGLEYLSKGMEHGHVHGNRFGTLAFLSLCLHAFIEAMPFGLEDLGEHVHDHHGHDHHGHHHHHAGESGWGLLFGIGLHKLPVAIALMTILSATVTSRVRRWTWVTVFAVVPFLGILLAGTLPQDAATFGALNGLLVGILLHIATTILFETADGHEFNGRKFLTVLLGLALSLMTTHL